MAKGRLEHANISVTDPERSAALLTELLGWEERWRGPSMLGGRTIHLEERQVQAVLGRVEWKQSPFRVDRLDGRGRHQRHRHAFTQ